MSITLYKMNISPPSRTVMVIAEILDLEIKTKEVILHKKENFKPEYLQKNPLHTIPLLEDEDFILADSHAIIIYLISRYGGEKGEELYPNNVQQRALVHHILFLDASILFPRLRAIIRAIAYENASYVEEKQKVEVEEAYQFLEKYLQSSSFLAGEKMSISDVSCVTTVSSLNLIVPIPEKYQKLLQWLNKLKNQDWYKAKNQPGLDDLQRFFTFFLKKNST